MHILTTLISTDNSNTYSTRHYIQLLHNDNSLITYTTLQEDNCLLCKQFFSLSYTYTTVRKLVPNYMISFQALPFFKNLDTISLFSSSKIISNNIIFLSIIHLSSSYRDFLLEHVKLRGKSYLQCTFLCNVYLYIDKYLILFYLQQ